MLRHLHFAGGYFIRRKLRRQVSEFLKLTENCQSVQAATLQRILDLNADSEYSRRNRLTGSLTPEQYQSRMPVSDFETIRAEIEQVKTGNHQSLLGRKNSLMMFALSSGTTAESKYIPITSEFLKDYRRGWNLWGVTAFDAHPRVLTSKIVQLTSNYEVFQTPGGVPCGNISGLVSKMQRPAVRFLYALPFPVSRIGDAESKLYTALRLSLDNPHVGMVMSANPSTLVQLAKLADRERESLIRDIADGTLTPSAKVSEETRQQLGRRITRPNRSRAKALERIVASTGHLHPRDFWPRLSLLGVWTGGSASAYLDMMRRFYGDLPVRDHGLSASEGRMSIPFSDGTSLGLLDIGSHFFEFIPEEEYESEQRTVLQAHELEEGRNYYILLTTVSGLYRYDIRDVVRCGGFRGTTPLVEFLHKGASTSSVTGEKLTESQVVSAVTRSVRELGVELDLYTVSPVWGDPPCYRLHIEESSVPHPRLLPSLLAKIDEQLQQVNCEYSEKRNSGRLAPLECKLLPSGTWKRFVQHRQSRRGGSLEQYKHPCLVPTLDFSETMYRNFAVAEVPAAKVA